ncbi:hypothetical protein COCNU_09G010070 [Cocos nucifera]|uniref:Uncharacterized protein n=1 Tax=Cocos nucifera TaxID=13894 RepID=A0A8K0ILH3_COCNU|nr:hypothetical protein COCNU_09G010070 [Cocos nucifera]
MDSARVKKLWRLSIRMRQTGTPTQSQVSEGLTMRDPDAVPLVTPPSRVVDQGEKDILCIDDSFMAVLKSKIELVNLLVEVMIVLANLRIEPVVEMTLPTSLIEVSIKVTTTKMEEIVGMFGPKASKGFAEVAEVIPAASHPLVEAQVETS